MYVLPQSVLNVQRGTVKGDAINDLATLAFASDADAAVAFNSGALVDGQSFIIGEHSIDNGDGTGSIYLCVRGGERVYRAKFDSFELVIAP